MTRRRKTRHQGKVGVERKPSRPRAPICVNAGIVGMGLMGSSIAACLLAAGHAVAAVEADLVKRRKAPRQVQSLLEGLRKEGLVRSDPRRILRKLMVSGNYSVLQHSEIVVECVTEDVNVKKDVIGRIEAVVSPNTIIGSNTSAIPPTVLQEGALHPERILGTHWAEPAHITRFMEIICGRDTLPLYAERALALTRQLGKEPSLLRKDARGFITNRVMYAMLREAFHLVESGVASIADVDRSLRNDLGYWITFAGPFRFMDLTGIPAYCAVMRDLLPDLDCSTEVPALMMRLVESGAQGVGNAKGFYRYTPAQARRWEQRFLKFSYDVRALARKYPDEDGPPERTDKVREDQKQT
ncbi:MAG TPA: 3-hydroxyacyl-CoA dehydrogenase family protein [Candidatus Sulfotelmatobacter sp.]|nr:3-hydroxyacyl-CoA dehydrogenase family protein [Candidatus Sulfotelmatobacter sp.]